MAIHYNLSKVYNLSENDPEFVLQIISLFATDIPDDLRHIEQGILLKDYKMARSYAHKIKPTLDLMGMNQAYEELLQIEDWANREGKRKEINATVDSIKIQVEKAIKEIKKNFDFN